MRKHTWAPAHNVVDHGVEIVKSIDDLVTSQSTQGKGFPDFEML